MMLGHGAPAAVPDLRWFLIDFLPIERRRLRCDGVSLHSIRYWSDVLRIWIGHRERTIVRYDLRDLSRIYLLGPDGAYYDVTYSDLRQPTISPWEHLLAIQRLRREGRAHVDEAAIFEAVEAMRAIADEAAIASNMACRQRERRSGVIQGALRRVQATCCRWRSLTLTREDEKYRVLGYRFKTVLAREVGRYPRQS
jgi:putative transposase